MAEEDTHTTESITSTEHVSSNLRYGIGVLLVAAFAIFLLFLPIFNGSFWLLLLRWVGSAFCAVLMVMAWIQILNYFNRKLCVDEEGVHYTNCIGQTRTFGWGEVTAVDIREKSHSLELILRGRVRTFHSSSTNFDKLVDYVNAHTELIKDTSK
ncbi:MAG: hypothetical protein DUD39_02370 [Coriobacteriaceae bacterium]|nr:MAG: hypothetical protein DUD39_02370 [Coriobacteriaceae bacterium]